jgi:hypothetical protein
VTYVEAITVSKTSSSNARGDGRKQFLGRVWVSCFMKLSSTDV